MNKRYIRIGEVICVLLLFLFIGFVSAQNKISTAPFENVAQAVTDACELKQLNERDKLTLKRKFSLEGDDFKGFIYYSSDSVMDVRELLVVSSDNKEVLSQTKEQISLYVEQKGKTFEGYAPEESELISSHVLIEKKGYLLFYIGEEKEKVISAFSESL